MSSPGDWMCAACQHMNFKKRDSCQKCGFPKFGSQADVAAYAHNRTEVLAGDWYCQAMNCGAHNFASRTSCYRCGALKSDYVGGYGGHMVASGGFGSENLIPGWKTGDWICSRPGCGVHNFASRIECFKCKMQRDLGKAL
ncbi:hypothetical protein Nepgr_006340 [Nepenthes gracilis]|uniref:RanBP2-type domain-containing protein n=1 Tax=Nepenthes gracilis TaxID=150966 RepID=A0AAD3XHB5_NEPGR|nr:hypothetical protein Nepgr_006340 [Nepenthes gracilis]